MLLLLKTGCYLQDLNKYLDVNDGKKIILDTLQILNDKKIGSRSNFMYWFIKNAPYIFNKTN